MNETLAGLVVARRAHEAGRRREPVPFRLHVTADAIFERASDAMHLVDLDTGPGRGAQANEQAHGPAVVGGKIKESGVFFAADHMLLPLSRRPPRRRGPGI